ncbi:MAG: D-alanyl-D-alanine carboxypeptidase/D-alanyl-D-alanine-endopeptidase [Actinomycetota bacterium]|nr:D-alanyl-D-alanine carboxypeptidase/D-alanyl-D-alanine-endopeptidase [Actinomycetota bacterium]
MPRLLRLLVVAVSALIVLAGGAVVVGQTSSRGASGSAPTTSELTVASTASTSGSRPGPTTPIPSTTVAPRPNLAPPLANLSARLDAALAGTTSCLVVEDSNGLLLYQHQPDTALIPASTQKLLVAAAALTILGPNFHFVTQVVAPAAPVAGQVANLWLVGGGDPVLATPEAIAFQAGRARVTGYQWTPLSGLADRLAAAGIRSVPGGIRGDDSHLDRLRFLPIWPAIYRTTQEVGLLSALSVNEGVQTLTPKVTLAADPPGFAASELARLLGQRHVVVGASGQDQTAPANGVVVATLQSAPLSQIIESMIRASDNWIAELVVRQIDRATGGTGTTAGGLAQVMAQAAAAGVPTAGTHMDDGSGLSHTDRATCQELLAALDLGNQATFAPLLSGLAVAGQTGTLAARYNHTAIAGKLRAKTGSLDNAGGLVGVLSVGPTLRFAYLANQVSSESDLYTHEDQVVAALATYPEGAAAAPGAPP